MSHSRDNLLPTNTWPTSAKSADLATVMETETTMMTHEVCRLYVLPQRRKSKKKTKKGKRK